MSEFDKLSQDFDNMLAANGHGDEVFVTSGFGPHEDIINFIQQRLTEKEAKIHALKKELKIQRENWSADIGEFTIREKELKEEIKRLHDKYDYQLLVKDRERLKAQLSVAVEALDHVSHHLSFMATYAGLNGVSGLVDDCKEALNQINAIDGVEVVKVTCWSDGIAGSGHWRASEVEIPNLSGDVVGYLVVPKGDGELEK